MNNIFLTFEPWLVAFIGGLVGSVFMDVAESLMARQGISSGVTSAFVGRWVYGFKRGVFVQSDITLEPIYEYETRLGIWFHYLVGGGLVALCYPIFLWLFFDSLLVNHLLWALLFGLLTTALPWLLLMPALGWGWFGRNSIPGTRPILVPVLSHLAYGLGLGISFGLYLVSVIRDI